MKEQELLQIIIAILAMTIISGFNELISFDISSLGLLLLFSFIIICGNILGKKIIALQLDSNVQHELWQWKRFGFRPAWHLKKSIPMGIILPIFFTIFTLGYFKIFTFLTYETRALKRRAARRFGHMSFTEMTDFHNSLIGAAGIIAVLLISFIGYWFADLSTLSKLAAYYAFFNLLPISKLDGTQIFFGSRVIYATLAAITLIFATYSILLV